MRFEMEAPDPNNPKRPHVLLRDREVLSNLRFVLDTLQRQGGTGAFIAYKRSGQRLIYKLKDKLPAQYRAEIVRGDPGSTESSKHRYQRYLTAMIIHQADSTPDQTPDR